MQGRGTERRPAERGGRRQPGPAASSKQNKARLLPRRLVPTAERRMETMSVPSQPSTGLARAEGGGTSCCLPVPTTALTASVTQPDPHTGAGGVWGCSAADKGLPRKKCSSAHPHPSADMHVILPGALLSLHRLTRPSLL